MYIHICVDVYALICFIHKVYSLYINMHAYLNKEPIVLQEPCALGAAFIFSFDVDKMCHLDLLLTIYEINFSFMHLSALHVQLL